MIAADFSLHNREWALDCFAFTFFPDDAWLSEIERDAVALPKELKKSKSLEDEAIEWLREPRRFHVAITVNKMPAVFSNGPGSAALTVAREHIDKTIAALASQNADAETVKRFKNLKKDSQANSFNVGLLAYIWLLSVWFASLTVLLARGRKCDIIAWLPDRDNMTNYCDHIWANYTLWNAQSFAEGFEVDMHGTQCPIGVPDRSGPKERLWFDYMIRAADWLAGAVGSWDRVNNLIPGEHRKYRQMLEDVITSANNIVILHFDITDTGMQFRRIVPTRKN
jgi:hypothetical protein